MADEIAGTSGTATADAGEGAGDSGLELPPGEETQEGQEAAGEGAEGEETSGAGTAGETGEEGAEGEEAAAAGEAGAAGTDEEKAAAAAKLAAEKAKKAEPAYEIEIEGETFKATPTQMVEILKKNEATIRQANEAIDHEAKVVKEVQSFIGDLQTDWTGGVMRALLSKHKGNEALAWQDLIEGSKKVYKQALEYQAMTPEQRGAIEAKKEAERYKAELEQLRGEKDRAAQADQEAAATEKMFSEAKPALKAAGLPINDHSLNLIVETYKYNRALGRKVTLKACAEFLKTESAKRNDALMSLALQKPDEFLEKFPEHAKALNDAILRKVRRGRSGAAGGAPVNGASAASGKASAGRDEPIVLPSALSSREFFAELDRQTAPKRKR